MRRLILATLLLSACSRPAPTPDTEALRRFTSMQAVIVGHGWLRSWRWHDGMESWLVELPSSEKTLAWDIAQRYGGKVTDPSIRQPGRPAAPPDAWITVSRGTPEVAP